MKTAGSHSDFQENRRAGLLTNILLIAAVCMLPLVRDPWALDSGKVPRLLILNLILAGFLAMMAFPAWRNCLIWSAVRHRVLFAFSAYTATVWVSLFYAGNVSAGLIDASRTTVALLLSGFAVVCFRSFEGWRASIAKAGIVAAVCIGILGDYQAANAPLAFPRRYAMSGITGLMGNVNLFAGYLMLLLPLCILGTAILRRWWRALAVLSTFHTAFLVVLLQTRSAWLGGACCLAVFAVVFAFGPVLLAEGFARGAGSSSAS